MNDENRRHFIQKQVLIFDFSSEEKSAIWHKTASTFYYRNMLPVINDALDTCFSEDHYYLDRLEINLGEIEEYELQDALVKILELELNRIIEKNKNQPAASIPDGKVAAGKNLFINKQKPAASIPDGNLRTGNNFFIKENNQNLIESFFYFLDHGVLQWNSRFNKISILEAEIKQETGFEKLISTSAFQQRLQQAEIRRRIYFQFSRSFWEELCIRCYKIEIDRLNAIQDILIKILILIAQTEPERKKIRQEIFGDIKEWIAIEAPSTIQDWYEYYTRWMIKKASPGTSPAEESATCKKIIKELVSSGRYQQNEETKVLLTVLNSITSPKYKPTQDKANYGPKSKEISIQKEEKIHPALYFSNLEILGKHFSGYPQTAFAEKGKQENKQIHQRNKEELTEYYVQQAGVLLTWPFLVHLFKHTGYLDKNEFKSLEHKQRAIHLLAYIASGKIQFEEQELVVSKLLCGWPLAMPIVKTVELTDEEKNEAEEMLQNLILRWSVLKNTSVNGLRDSFFLRDGKLLREDEHWRLLVEQKSYDMLLEHLPYSISLIRLPWNKEILKVDWI